MKPLLVKSIYNQTIWAGDKLNAIRCETDALHGTCWEVSAHPFAESLIENDEFKDQRLSDVIKAFPVETLGKDIHEDQLLRSAWLDAKEALSVQVHPTEAYALAHENDHGKVESWYVMEANDNATLVAGSDFSSKEELIAAIENDTIESHLRRVHVQAGDFIEIPAGTLHALGAGILAIEIGTNSNVTYRFYDYHRKDSKGNERELHVQKSLDVVQLNYAPVAVHTQNLKNDIQQLCSNEAFDTYVADFEESVILPAQSTFRILTNVGKQDVRFVVDGEELLLKRTHSAFIPADCSDITVIGNSRLFIGTVKAK